MNYVKQYIGMFSLTKFYTLVVLVNRPLHVYAICYEIAHESGGAVFPSRQGVRCAVKTLLEAHLVAETRSIMQYQHPRQGSTYRITSAGLQRLKKEAADYQRAATLARIRIQG